MAIRPHAPTRTAGAAKIAHSGSRARATKASTEEVTTGGHDCLDEVARDLRLLRSILQPAAASKVSSAPDSRSKSRSLIARSRTNARSKPHLAVDNDPKSQQDGSTTANISASEQKKIAMDIFNASLRFLSKSAKQHQENKKSQQIIKPASIKRPISESSIRASNAPNVNDTEHHAECASLALDVLRKHDNEDTDADEARTKREHSAIALLDRLITLEMTDLAYDQASKIHEQYWKRRKGCGGSTESSLRSSHRVKLHELILKPMTQPTRHLYEITYAFQCQILRLVILQDGNDLESKLLDSIDLATDGNPAGIILTGRRQGLVDPKKAVDNLLVVAQMLVRLYSTLCRRSETSMASLALSILQRALSYRIAAFSLSREETKLDTDMWSTLEKAIKQHWIKIRDDSALYITVATVIEHLQRDLVNADFSRDIPAALLRHLAPLAGSHNDIRLAKLWLNGLISLTEGLEKATHLCEIATVSIQSGLDPSDDVYRAYKALDACTEASIAPNALLSIVRFRKACSQAVQGMAKFEQETMSTEGRSNSECIQAMYTILQFLASYVSNAKGNASQSIFLALLKSIEALVDIEKCVFVAEDSILDTYFVQMRSCIDLLRKHSQVSNGIESGSEFLASTKIKLSNMLWRAHLLPSILKRGIKIVIDLASQSIECLSYLPMEALGKAALGPRLEKLATLQLENGNAELARLTLVRSIKHYIATGALADAVEVSLTKRRCDVWTDAAALSSQLGRALHTLCNSYCPSDARNFYDDQELSDIQRAVLRETQILYLSKKDLSNSDVKDIIESTKDVLQLVDFARYWVWRVRLLSTMVFRLSRLQNLSAAHQQTLHALIIEEVSRPQSSPDTFLISYKCSLYCTLLIQSYLLTDRVDRSLVEQELLRLNNQLNTGSENLSSFIDDIQLLHSCLNSYSDRTFAGGNYQDTVVALNVQIRISSFCATISTPNILRACISLTLCHVRLNDIASAKRAIEQSKELASETKIPSEHQIAFLLTVSEVELASGQEGACQHHLQEAAKIFNRACAEARDIKRAKRLERDSTVATAALLASRLAMHKGLLSLAVRYARQAAKICVSIWTALQKPATTPTEKDDSTMFSLTGDLSRLEIDKQISDGSGSSNKNKDLAWPYLNLYIDCLYHAATVFAQCGISADALHYLEQLQKVCSADRSCDIILTPQSLYAKILVFSGASEQASKLCESVLKNSPASTTVFMLVQTCLKTGDVQTAKLLNATIKNAAVSSSLRFLECNDSQAETHGGQRKINSSKKSVRGPPKRPMLRFKPEAEKQLLRKPEKVQDAAEEWCRLKDQDMQQSLLKDIVLAEDAQGPPNELLIAEEDFIQQPKFLVNDILSTAKCIYRSAWYQLRSNSMQSVLADSALALPTKYSGKRVHGRVSLLQSTRNLSTSPVVQDSTSSKANSQQSGDVADQLQLSRRLCSEILENRKQFCSTIQINFVTRLEARITLLLSTMDQPFALTTMELVLRMAAPFDECLAREMMISTAEELTANHQNLSVWPDKFDEYQTADFGLATERLNDLPKSWLIVTITLAETRDELIISKIMAGRDPFLVRIPLYRSNEGEISEEFSFEDALLEMRNIVVKANASCHDERRAGDKRSRVAWHREREDLDERLGFLLQNVESAWLGGFRGIMSPPSATNRTTQAFRDMLNRALDRHLPSRQKSSGPTETTLFHDEVLNLFLGLDNLESEDAEDAIMDLLYFVVDILQFSGENNAYDEIDWDALLVDTMDALRSCHETRNVHSAYHTILVLDKELECIPWESLPCMIEHPTSRMPSLGSIFERLDKIRKQSDTSGAFSIAAASLNGSYILNPGRNLASTQERLGPILTSSTITSSFSAIVESPPSETQISAMLSSSDVLLYFGHGSGAQYIRARAIRALPQCATTFLFGCSSAKMTEHGEYESTGMPRAYMLGHSPAVVGCLWDVTDREIDRVAVKTMSEWGLVDGSDARVQEVLSRTNPKGKAKKAEKCRLTRESKTIVEAVLAGRKAAVLKYLCGAAVVVYGVPVTLA